MKAPATYPEDIACRGCGERFVGDADSARYHRWKIGWLPDMPNWCPRCWNNKTQARKAAEGVLLIPQQTLFDS